MVATVMRIGIELGVLRRVQFLLNLGNQILPLQNALKSADQIFREYGEQLVDNYNAQTLANLDAEVARGWAIKTDDIGNCDAHRDGL
jgi:hypothetical protein